MDSFWTLCEGISGHNSSVIRQKSESQNGRYNKTKHTKYVRVRIWE